MTPTDLPLIWSSEVTVSPGATIIEFNGTGTTVATAMTGRSFCWP